MDEIGISDTDAETGTASVQSTDLEEDNVDELKVARKWNAFDSISEQYDHLGSTPPRTRIRNKEKMKNIKAEESASTTQPLRFQKVIRRNTTDNIVMRDTNAQAETYEQKRVKRRSMKILRGTDRDLKLDIEKTRSNLSYSIDRPLQMSMTSKLVESCNRFKSLHSQPICHSKECKDEETAVDGDSDDRMNFYNAFSLSIRLGSDKNCKRAMSVEEITWQNELKDLLWLEVCAHRAGRTPTQQDSYLLQHRDAVPALLQKILDYKFIYNDQKCNRANLYSTQVSMSNSENNLNTAEDRPFLNFPGNSDRFMECLCIDCPVCSKATGRALKEVEDLLNSLSEAEALYSSCRGMSMHHPIINSEEFINKTKAMCLWYNMMHHQRLKILIIKKLLHKHRWKSSPKQKDADLSTEKAETSHTCQKVKFNMNAEIINDCNETDDDDDVKQSPVSIRITPESKDETDASCSIDKIDFAKADLLKSPYESTESSGGSNYSNDSGFITGVSENLQDSPSEIKFDKYNVYNMGSLADLTKLRLFNPKLSSPYRDYIEKILKVRGLKRALYFLEKLHLSVLKKARMTLEQYEVDILNEEVELRGEADNDSSDDDFEYERHSRCGVDVGELKKECIELRRYGAWSKETLDMNLPSYRSAFLFLSTYPMENIHEYLTMRLESKPIKPSALSIKQLIYELKEGLSIAVRLRGRYVKHIYTALSTEPGDSRYQKFYTKILDTFDNTLDEVYKLYLSYLSDWASMEYLPRSCLSSELMFNKHLAQRIKLAATIAPLTFCCLTVRQLDSAAERLKARIVELRKTADEYMNDKHRNNIKLRLLNVCRNLQCILSEERDKALNTAQFARLISSQLYHNAVFRQYRQKIYKSMLGVQNVVCWTIDRMQETTSPQRLLELDESDRPSIQSRTREIISQGYKFGFEFHKELCRLINDDNSPESGYNSLSRNSFSFSRPSRLVRSDSINLENMQSSMEDGYFYNSYTPSSQAGEFMFPTDLKRKDSQKSKDEAAIYYSLYGRNMQPHRNRRSPRAGIINDLSDLGPEDFQNGIPGCEACNGFMCDINEAHSFKKREEWEKTISRSLVQFAKHWMNFAMTRCDRGRGLRPRWANHGLEFLMLTCDPRHTKHLTSEEFEELKSMMDGCISHVIGSSRGMSTSVSSATATPPPQRARQFSHTSNRSYPPTSPSTPPIDFDPNADLLSHQNKQTYALNKLDNERDNILRRAGCIGVVRHGSRAKHHFRPRPVTFKWQRGIKIGQGRFGKVYTVVNTESGQVLAMKEISLGVGDRRSIDLAANELQVLESVVHPNLVRYYGVEIHREEMLIFMELCVEGSLESMIVDYNSDNESTHGLPEQMIRRYTGQLVSAIRALHDRSIAHRDIKSGNIFLTDGGNCLKLGDFGCAVKIRANTTVPGELQGYVGTQAYMAPEMFMKSSGHGRAADIWSLGCVVVEMASGKHPWSEYDSNYQIMFVVGMGNRPEIPETLSAEGTDFCMACLQHDPVDRSSAEILANHHFLKVNRY